MDIYTASEVAYKNGYEAGVKEFAERLEHGEHGQLDWEYGTIIYTQNDIDNVLKELTKNDAEG